MARETFTEEELNSGIVQSKKKDSVESLSNQPADVENPTIVAYTLQGKEISVDDKTAYAKKDGNKLYVKSNGGILYDPRGLYSTDLHKKVGDRSIWSWKRVGIRAFEYYFAYLQKGNKSHYINASREIM